MLKIALLWLIMGSGGAYSFEWKFKGIEDIAPAGPENAKLICPESSPWASLHKDNGFMVYDYTIFISGQNANGSEYLGLRPRSPSYDSSQETIKFEQVGNAMIPIYGQLDDVSGHFRCLGSYATNLMLLGEKGEHLTPREREIFRHGVAKMAFLGKGVQDIKFAGKFAALSLWAAAALLDLTEDIFARASDVVRRLED